jgi:hypothetical protein
VLEASLECLVNVVRQGLLGLQVNRVLLENLDPEGQRVSASKEKREMMVRYVSIASFSCSSLNLNFLDPYILIVTQQMHQNDHFIVMSRWFIGVTVMGLPPHRT